MCGFTGNIIAVMSDFLDWLWSVSNVKNCRFFHSKFEIFSYCSPMLWYQCNSWRVERTSWRRFLRKKWKTMDFLLKLIWNTMWTNMSFCFFSYKFQLSCRALMGIQFIESHSLSPDMVKKKWLHNLFSQDFLRFETNHTESKKSNTPLFFKTEHNDKSLRSKIK